MNWIAWKMLTGDKSKYFGIVFGIAFAALLMAQQSSIFVGLMRNTTSQIRDVQGSDIWVMDSNVQFIDDLKPMSDNELQRVRDASPRSAACWFQRQSAANACAVSAHQLSA